MDPAPLTFADLQWALGILGAIGLAMLGVWWRVESRQDKKIDKMEDENSDSHRKLFDKVDDVKDQMNNQHHHLLNKIEEIWRHMKNGDKGPR